MSNKEKVLIISIVILLVFFFFVGDMFFIIDQTQRGMILRFGNPVAINLKPGLHFKFPSFIDKLVVYDIRIKDYDASPREIITRDKKNLVVDNYCKWRISDLLKFYRSVKDEFGANGRLDDIVYSELRNECSQYNLIEIVNSKRDLIMKKVTENTRNRMKNFGIDIVDVRIKRADLPKENEAAVYNRMTAERKQKAKYYRSTGKKEELKIKAEADKKSKIILAEAKKKAMILKGEGEAEVTRILADAYGKGADFYSFYQSIQVLKKNFKKNIKIITGNSLRILKVLFEK